MQHLEGSLDVAVQLKAVHKSFGKKGLPALIDVSLEVQRGEFLVISGASGAGKSTLLRLLYGALRADAGDVYVLGYILAFLGPSQLPELRRQIGVIYQDFKLLPRRTVFENVALTLRVLGLPRRIIQQRVTHLLAQVGLSRKPTAYPAELSGGEQQRVAVA